MERLLHRDLVVRVLSLLLAVVLWVQVTGESSAPSTRTLENVPLRPINKPADLEVVGQRLPESVRVTLTGPKRELNRVIREEFTAYVDFADRGTGTYNNLAISVCLRQGACELPPGVTAVISPSTVTVQLERRITREVAVTLPPGARDQVIDDVRYQLQVPEQKVNVTGLESAVGRVVRVEVVPDLSGVQESGPQRMLLQAVDSTGAEVSGVVLDPTSMNVNVTTTPLPPAKVVPVRPRFEGSPPEGYTFTATPSPESVRVRGPRSFHDQWVEVATERISLIGQTHPFTVQVNLVMPQGAELIETTTATVMVTIQETRIERTIEQVPLQIWNLAGNLEAVPAVSQASIRVRGFKGLLDQLEPLALAPHLDLEGIGPGTHSVPVRWVKPEGVEVLAVIPQQVEVVVTEKPPPEPELPELPEPPGNPGIDP